ncbi:MAG: SprT family zinc-dependent metalloprotease [Pseudomonadales bacterium]
MVGLKIPFPERTLIEGIPVEVRRSKRRRTRIGLAFDPAGFVLVEAPLDAGAGEIRGLIREHKRWLQHRLDKVTNATGLTACLSYRAGELIHFLGNPYELVVRDGRIDTVMLKPRRSGPEQLGLFSRCHVRGQILVTLQPCARQVVNTDRVDARVRTAVDGWYRARAEEQFAVALGVWRSRLPWLRGKVPAWRHRYMRSQWGSCSRSGRISLNTHLVKAPTQLIDYVVLHELCHLQHYDHGPRFYGLMTRHMPDWQTRRGELDHYLPVLLQD